LALLAARRSRLAGCKLPAVLCSRAKREIYGLHKRGQIWNSKSPPDVMSFVSRVPVAERSERSELSFFNLDKQERGGRGGGKRRPDTKRGFGVEHNGDVAFAVCVASCRNRRDGHSAPRERETFLHRLFNAARGLGTRVAQSRSVPRGKASRGRIIKLY